MDSLGSEIVQLFLGKDGWKMRDPLKFLNFLGHTFILDVLMFPDNLPSLSWEEMGKVRKSRH